MIKYKFFPRSLGLSDEMKAVIDCFKSAERKISSEGNELTSNQVLAFLRPSLQKLGYSVESGKKRGEKIDVPVLFGTNNSIDKSFYADALSSDRRIVVEIEAGRAVDNNQFLKDLFQACMMFEVEYLILAVRNKYRKQDDFESVYTFFETLYISNRVKLPLKGILLIGY
ncbi:MAG: hypothetical protein IJX22_03410 [Opitutales bacterium]|nr:hypothetical protein [Opitutales bacterium]